MIRLTQHFCLWRAMLLVPIALVVCISLLFTSLTPAFAAGGTTGSVNGMVTDGTSGAPLANVSVAAAAPAGRYTSQTDDKGFYSFTGVVADTYLLSFQLKGYEAQSFAGVTVEGDQRQQVNASLRKALTTIGRVTSRSTTSAYQPNQTIDSYTVSGARVDAALGKKDNTGETALILSVPGTQINAYGALAIRGSLRTEVSYQFDGIDYTEPLGNQFANNVRINGLAQLQVVPGAGDPTQGNSGAGVVNIVPKRGSHPSFGLLDLETNLNPYNHQFALDYGWATPNGRFSNYTSFIGYRQGLQSGQYGASAAQIGAYYGFQSSNANDFINNMVYKFGHNDSQALQFLYQSRVSEFQYNYGGLQNQFYKTNDPATLASLRSLSGLSTAQIQSIIGLYPGQASVTQAATDLAVQIQPLEAYELKYTNNLNASTFLQVRGYHLQAVADFENPYTSFGTRSRQNFQGGTRLGGTIDFTKQLGDKHLVTLNAKIEQEVPVFNIDGNISGFQAIAGFGTGNEVADFLAPPNLAAAISASNPCPVKNGCYLAAYFPNGIPSIPSYAINEKGFTTNQYGVAIRDQVTLNAKLKLDGGIRFDAMRVAYPNAADYDVKPITDSQVSKPRVWEPRLAAAYQAGNNDAFRFSYGRSVIMPAPTVLFTPIDKSRFAAFRGIPATAKVCGSPSGPSGGGQTCKDYADQLYWEQSNAFDYPELSPLRPSTYNNYDATYAHQFRNGSAIKISPFYRRGYDVVTIVSDFLGVDPATGLNRFGPSTPTNKGINRTAGVEFYATTKDRPVGLTGFVSATYVNEFTNVPPQNGVNLEDFYPGIPSASIALGNLYRAGFLTPLYIRSGATYKWKSGWRVNPIVTYDRGYPYGAGNTAAFFINGKAYNVPNTNVTGPNGPQFTANYVDPQNPGSLYKPNIAATRGTSEGTSAGQYLTSGRFNTDITFEYSPPNSKSTFGLGVTNLFNQLYTEPTINSLYQPVAPGVAGPLTGKTSNAILYPQLGQANFGPNQFGYFPYRLIPSNTPIAFKLYYQVQL